MKNILSDKPLNQHHMSNLTSIRVDNSQTVNRVLLLSPVFDFATDPSPECRLGFLHRRNCMMSCVSFRGVIWTLSSDTE